MSHTTNTAPAFMLTAGTIAVDTAGMPWTVQRVKYDDHTGEVLAFYTDTECVRLAQNEAVQVMPPWEYELVQHMKGLTD